MNDNNLFTLILAAGRSSRFGTLKQLAEYRGQTLVQRAMDLAQQTTGHRLLLVTGAQWQEVVADSFPAKGFFVRNEDYEDGIASSIACGIRGIEQIADAVLITLVDQPLVSAEHLQNLKARWQTSQSCIIASEFAETVGPPLIFPSAYFSSLKALNGDRGAKSLLHQYSEKVIRIQAGEAATDIDTADDLKKLY